MEQNEQQSSDLSILVKIIKYIFLGGLILFPIFYLYYIISLPQTVEKTFLDADVGNCFIFLITGGVFAGIITYSFKKKHAMSKEKKHTIFQLLTIAIVIYACYLFLYSIGRYLSFASEAIDVPYFHYAMVQLAHFQIPKIWDSPGRYVWADHFSPILILLVPFYWIFPDGLTLMAVEAGVVISGGIPLYLAAKGLLKSKFLALALVFAYLTFGGLQVGYAYGFHEIVLFPTFFLWMYYFYLRKKYILYFLFVFLTLCIKEEVSFIIFFWGLYTLFFHKHKVISLATIVFGGLWYFLVFYVAFPHFNPGGNFGYWGQYSGVHESGGIVDFIKSVVFHPLQFLTTLVTPSYKIGTIFRVFTPFIFLPFLYPPSLLIIFPSLMEKLLSNGLPSQYGYHYSAAITGVTVVACIETLSFLSTSVFWKKYFRRVFFVAALLYCAFAANTLYGYSPLSPLLINYYNERTLSDVELQTLQNTIALLPKDASVSAHAVIIPHLHKPKELVKHGPLPNDTSDYILWDTKLHDFFINSDPSVTLNTLVTANKYKVLLNENSVILLQRVK